MTKMSLTKRASKSQELTEELRKHETANREAEQAHLNNPLFIVQQLHDYRFAATAAQSRKARQEELMQRPIAKKWDAAKKAKNVRRLVRAGQELEQAVSFVGQLEAKLEQVLGTSSAV